MTNLIQQKIQASNKFKEYQSVVLFLSFQKNKSSKTSDLHRYSKDLKKTQKKASSATIR